ncbi:hypothetical protein B0A48_03036 [Cryoendolithus antarcticus]|uniref:Bilirubin oxidase n=1 Tax=Cryoendolithus antarcticus TaxID=1507870 RepID=A0A1V8TM63_9PEZI|nr:hypothetical protein B0A48_03036 [Cryoendolithus antarcticus]
MWHSARLLLVTIIAGHVFAKDWESPPYTNLYSEPLPIPPTKSPLKTFTFPNQAPIDYYEIDIKPLEQQVYPGKAKTRLVGYDGVSPGPTFRMTKGREAIVRFINHGDLANSVHLHGSYSRAPFDGWAEDVTPRQSYKDYYYPNQQNARMLWYHDHAIDHTAQNAYLGQAGAYILTDSEEQAITGLPKGNYEVPLTLASKRYNSDGSLFTPDANGVTDNLFGDLIHVNGQPWPYLKVEPRKYRLRFLNAAISRSFQLYFEASGKLGTRITFNVVASDAGLLLKPVASTQLDISMAERWEVVFDFAGLQGQNVTLRSNANIPSVTPYLHTDKVMRFVVGSTVTDSSNNDALPAKLRDVPFPPNKNGLDHAFEFQRTNGEWKINGVSWADGPEARVLAKPQRGNVERWELKNGAGGWTHPIHIHLVDFQIVSRTGGDRPVLPYEAVALKDVVWLNTNEVVNVIARYAPWDGLYMFHCHNLIHEDHEMMAAFNVTALDNLGYNETTRFIDPMEATYRAKPFNDADWIGRTGDFSDAAISAKATFFNKLNAYSEQPQVDAALQAYWKTKATQTATTLSTKTRRSVEATAAVN